MAEQKLNTRIISKHVTLDQANNGTWRPYEGEIVLARVDTQKPDGHGGIITVPTYLMKVGAYKFDDQGNKTDELYQIKDLQWAHAPASDVYAWAKQSKLAIVDTEEGNVITSIEATDAGITVHRASVATSQVVEELTTRVGNEETARANADTALDNKITAINENLDGTTEGGIGARLTAVEDAFDTYKDTTVPGLLDEKVDVSTYNSKMSEIDTAIGTTIPAAYTAADDAVKAELIGAEGSTKDSATIAGAKLYADDVATTKANAAQAAAEATAAGALADAKSELEDSISELAQTVGNNEVNNNNIHEGFNTRIETLEDKVENVANVMDFVGAGASLPAAESSNKGDVFVINEGDNAGKEYVFDGTTWVEFGFATANENAISQLQEDLEQLGKDVEATYATKAALQEETNARAQAITDVTTAFGNADTALKTELEGKIADANTDAYDRAVAEAARLDGLQTTAITTAYEAADSALRTDITALQNEVNGTPETSEGAGDAVKGLRTLITEEAARADAAEKANAAAIKAISDDYLTSSDKTELSEATAAVADDLETFTETVEGNFAKVTDGKLTVGGNVIIFDCGGVEEA